MKHNSITETLTKESIFIIGTVSSVEGRKVKVKVNKNKNLSHISYQGKIIKNVSVGSYVKITKGFVEIIGKVEGEYTKEENVYNEEYKTIGQKISRFLEVSLFGHFENDKFKQGIKEMPLIDNECFILDNIEFEQLHRFYTVGEQTIKIGTLTENPQQSIQLSINRLFAGHIGVFGNTGSGKSNTLTKLYTELFNESKNLINFKNSSRFVFIDFNGEYTKEQLISKDKDLYNLSTKRNSVKKYPIKKSNIENLEIISILLEATEKTQTPFLKRALIDSYFDLDKESIEVVSNNVKKSIESIIKFILHKRDPNLNTGVFQEFFLHLNKVKSEDDKVIEVILAKIESGLFSFHSFSKDYKVQINGKSFYSDSSFELVFENVFSELNSIFINLDNFGLLKFKIINQYYFEVINGYSNQEHIKPLIGRMFKKFEMLEKLVKIEDDQTTENADNVQTNEKQIKTNLEIIDLKDVNLEMKKTLPLIIVKQLYEEHKHNNLDKKKSLHIIIDEAHNILSSTSERESETWKDYRLETFEEIIKEGRKFSTFLTVSSQRPYDISPTIISQLHNYFIHRLINDNDIKAIEKTVAYMDKFSFESIPVLTVGSCFISGSVTDIPIKVDVDLLESSLQPNSDTIDLVTAWGEEVKPPLVN